jgi:hypothetical protein
VPSFRFGRGPRAVEEAVVPALPPRPDLDQLRRQAKDLLRAARDGDPAATTRLASVAGTATLASAQLVIAREYGFPSWARLKAEVERRAMFDRADLAGLAALLTANPAAAREPMEHWRDYPLGTDPLGYVAMLRYDTARGVWRDVAGTAGMARALLAAGALVDGEPGAPESPLITAASYGDAGVARVLVDAGADLEATAAATAGGVPGGTALLHAAVFGMTAVVDVLIAAGARIPDLVQAAAAGDVRGRLRPGTAEQERTLALIMAADHQRLPVIDALVAAGTPVDGADPRWGRHPLRTAAGNGRPAAVRRLLAHGADPTLRDPDGRTPLDLCRSARGRHDDTRGYDEVEALLTGARA